MPFTSYFLVQEIMEIHDLLEEKCSFKTLAEKMAQICGIKLQEMGKGKLGRQSTYFIFVDYCQFPHSDLCTAISMSNVGAHASVFVCFPKRAVKN